MPLTLISSPITLVFYSFYLPYMHVFSLSPFIIFVKVIQSRLELIIYIFFVVSNDRVMFLSIISQRYIIAKKSKIDWDIPLSDETAETLIAQLHNFCNPDYLPFGAFVSHSISKIFPIYKAHMYNTHIINI